MITDSSSPYLVCTCASHALLLATYVMHSGTFLSLDQLVLHNYIVPVWSLGVLFVSRLSVQSAIVVMEVLFEWPA